MLTDEIRSLAERRVPCGKMRPATVLRLLERLATAEQRQDEAADALEAEAIQLRERLATAEGERDALREIARVALSGEMHQTAVKGRDDAWKALAAMERQLAEAQAQVAALREALAYYADQENYRGHVEDEYSTSGECQMEDCSCGGFDPEPTEPEPDAQEVQE